MKLKITIMMDNAAFDGDGGGSEAARILRQLADRIDGGMTDKTRVTLWDLYGNQRTQYARVIPPKLPTECHCGQTGVITLQNIIGFGQNNQKPG